MERSTIFTGKTHYKFKYLAMFNSYISYVKLPEGRLFRVIFNDFLPAMMINNDYRLVYDDSSINNDDFP